MSASIESLLDKRILVLDGAMGTMIQAKGLGEADYRGERFSEHSDDLLGNNELLTLSRPDVIESIHHAFLEANADIIETNTFGANAVAQADYGLESICRELNVEAARLARRAADAWTARTPDRPRFVAGAIGPTPRTLSISPDVADPAARNITFDALLAVYREAALGLIEGGADLILVETIFDTLNAKAALVAIDEIFEERGERPAVRTHRRRRLRQNISSAASRPRAAGGSAGTLGGGVSAINASINSPSRSLDISQIITPPS